MSARGTLALCRMSHAVQRRYPPNNELINPETIYSQASPFFYIGAAMTRDLNTRKMLNAFVNICALPDLWRLSSLLLAL